MCIKSIIAVSVVGIGAVIKNQAAKSKAKRMGEAVQEMVNPIQEMLNKEIDWEAFDRYREYVSQHLAIHEESSEEYQMNRPYTQADLDEMAYENALLESVCGSDLFEDDWLVEMI